MRVAAAHMPMTVRNACLCNGHGYTFVLDMNALTQVNLLFLLGRGLLYDRAADSDAVQVNPC